MLNMFSPNSAMSGQTEFSTITQFRDELSKLLDMLEVLEEHKQKEKDLNRIIDKLKERLTKVENLNLELTQKIDNLQNRIINSNGDILTDPRTGIPIKSDNIFTDPVVHSNCTIRNS